MKKIPLLLLAFLSMNVQADELSKAQANLVKTAVLIELNSGNYECVSDDPSLGEKSQAMTALKMRMQNAESVSTDSSPSSTSLIFVSVGSAGKLVTYVNTTPNFSTILSVKSESLSVGQGVVNVGTLLNPVLTTRLVSKRESQIDCNRLN